MADLFNYQTLHTSLHSASKSLIVEINRPTEQNAINEQMIMEIESLLSWATTHLEINSILFRSFDKEIPFSIGPDDQEIQTMSAEQFYTFLRRLQNIVYSLFFLPQTIVMDLGKGAMGLAAELAVGADLRLATQDTIIHFNHLQKGLTPFCGGIGQLCALVAPTWARQWILSGKEIKAEELYQSGFINTIYEENSPWEEILMNIAAQAPVARIQAKRSFLETILPLLDRAAKEKEFAMAALATGDWRVGHSPQHPKFKSARDVAQIVKEKSRTVQN
ncbi:MAG: enoyl-CoA hydratase/isomerase family protein [Pseudomonadota bacterium]